MRKVCEKKSSRMTGFCEFCWKNSACTLLPNTTTQLFLRVCLPTLFAAVLKFFLPPTTSAISGRASCNKSAPTRFAAETKFYGKMELKFAQKLVQVHRIPVHVVDHKLYRMEFLLFLKQPSCNVFWVRN